MKQWWSYFDPATGRLTGLQVYGPEGVAMMNCPDGREFIAGQWNAAKYTVVVVGGVPTAQPVPAGGGDVTP
ncbi:MAG: hypothetical protein HS128_19115 [Ideonella sp.]|nr:hypothetical protein [Ideonella sp.]MCC7455999.1 hypothetical protein [Nitrospira sp.]